MIHKTSCLYHILIHIRRLLGFDGPIRVGGEWVELFGLFCPPMFAQLHTRAAAVLVDEFDASRF